MRTDSRVLSPGLLLFVGASLLGCGDSEATGQAEASGGSGPTEATGSGPGDTENNSGSDGEGDGSDGSDSSDGGSESGEDPTTPAEEPPAIDDMGRFVRCIN